jgi:putative ABC transport system permease protein
MTSESASACWPGTGGMTLTVLLTFALGIGANTAIFTVDYATLLAPLPYPRPEQLVMVWSKFQKLAMKLPPETT